MLASCDGSKSSARVKSRCVRPGVTVDDLQRGQPCRRHVESRQVTDEAMAHRELSASQRLAQAVILEGHLHGWGVIHLELIAVFFWL